MPHNLRIQCQPQLCGHARTPLVRPTDHMHCVAEPPPQVKGACQATRGGGAAPQHVSMQQAAAMPCCWRSPGPAMAAAPGASIVARAFEVYSMHASAADGPPSRCSEGASPSGDAPAEPPPWQLDAVVKAVRARGRSFRGAACDAVGLRDGLVSAGRPEAWRAEGTRLAAESGRADCNSARCVWGGVGVHRKQAGRTHLTLS